MKGKKHLQTVSRTPYEDEKFDEFSERGWNLVTAFYSCHDAMYHYIFVRSHEPILG